MKVEVLPHKHSSKGASCPTRVITYALVCVLLWVTTGCGRSGGPIERQDDLMDVMWGRDGYVFPEAASERYCALLDNVYHLMPLEELTATLGDPDRKTRNLRRLGQFGLPSEAYALVWKLGRYDCYVVVDKASSAVSNMVFVHGNLGHDAIASKGEVLGDKINVGMSEAEVLQILGKPDRIEDGSEVGSPGEYWFHYYDTVRDASSSRVIRFSKKDKRVLSVVMELIF